MPFYACDCPRGHQGTWTHVPSGKIMRTRFDPLSLTLKERRVTMHACSRCDIRWWDDDGERVGLHQVLELAAVPR